MNLRKKKELAARTLNVGKEKIIFLKPRLDEIKEAITKEDVRDLKKEGAIIIKEDKGRKKIKKRKHRRGVGKVKKKIKTRKRDYVLLTRKLRKYLVEVKKQGKLTREEIITIRKKIRNKMFRSKTQLKDYIGGLGR